MEWPERTTSFRDERAPTRAATRPPRGRPVRSGSRPDRGSARTGRSPAGRSWSGWRSSPIVGGRTTRLQLAARPGRRRFAVAGERRVPLERGVGIRVLAPSRTAPHRHSCSTATRLPRRRGGCRFRKVRDTRIAAKRPPAPDFAMRRSHRLGKRFPILSHRRPQRRLQQHVGDDVVVHEQHQDAVGVLGEAASRAVVDEVTAAQIGLEGVAHVAHHGQGVGGVRHPQEIG